MFWDKDKEDGDGLELELLVSTQDEFILLTTKAILEDENIPYILKSTGPGGYMRILGGTSVYPTDILVEKSTFGRASELIEGLNL